MDTTAHSFCSFWASGHRSPECHVMSSQSAELDSAAMAGPIQAGGHYATPTPPRHRKRLITHQVGVWLTADGGGAGALRGGGEDECQADCGNGSGYGNSQGLLRSEQEEQRKGGRDNRVGSCNSKMALSCCHRPLSLRPRVPFWEEVLPLWEWGAILQIARSCLPQAGYHPSALSSPKIPIVG